MSDNPRQRWESALINQVWSDLPHIRVTHSDIEEIIDTYFKRFNEALSTGWPEGMTLDDEEL